MALWMAMLVGRSVQSRLKYLNTYSMDIYGAYSMNPKDFSSSATMLTFLDLDGISQPVLAGLPLNLL